MAAAPPIDLDYLSSRFWARVGAAEDDECWPWLLSTGGHGYGQTWDGITVRYAHRCAWELTNGRIPQDMTIDHICRNRVCCNPAHLRLLTNSENGRGNAQSVRTSCPQGHPYDEVNTYRAPAGGRRCRTCGRQRH